MKSNIALISIAILAAGSLAGCAKQQVVKAQPQPRTAALAACARSMNLSPKLDGAARTGQGQQPVLVVSTKGCEGG